MTRDDTSTDRILNRRRFLRATGVVAAGATLAGCAGPEEGGGAEEGGGGGDTGTDTPENDVDADNPFGPGA